MLVPLTDKELALHRKAVGRLRLKLFSVHSPAEYGIIESSERVLDASVETRVALDSQQPDRVLYLGGLGYDFESQGARRSWFDLKHAGDGQFWLTILWSPQPLAAFTRFSVTLPFSELGNKVYEFIETVRREAAPVQRPDENGR